MLRPVTALLRMSPPPARRTGDRRRLRLRLGHDRAAGRRRTRRAGAGHRHLPADAGASAATRARGRAGRFRAGRRHHLPVRAGAADLVASRFGVMFFADPPRSFANLRSALRRGGRVAFVCWRAARENPWMMVPLQAALPSRFRNAPSARRSGPFAFASAERVERILREAGFAEVKLTPHDLTLDIAAGGGLDAAVESAVEIGPAHSGAGGCDRGSEGRRHRGGAPRSCAPPRRRRAVPLGAAVWIVTATAP